LKDGQNLTFSSPPTSSSLASRAGGTVKGDPVKDIIKTALDHGVNFFGPSSFLLPPV